MVLDHIDNLSAQDDNDFALTTLARLSQGIFWLYDSVDEAETLVRKRAAKENINIGVIDGVLKDVPTDIPIEWLSCAFQWYAVSAYNYARLVGWLTYKDAKQAKDYCKHCKYYQFGISKYRL